MARCDISIDGAYFQPRIVKYQISDGYGIFGRFNWLVNIAAGISQGEFIKLMDGGCEAVKPSAQAPSLLHPPPPS